MKVPITPPFRDKKNKIIKGSIAISKFLKLGGISQWVLVRGENIKNPLLVILHGGPGFSDTTFFRYFNSSLERKFTVVYWDQRGTGKSFHKSIPRSSMNVNQFVSDLDELVKWICKRVNKNKVTILGHSWGSLLGVLYAAKFPKKVSAYIGCAQIGDWSEGEMATYNYALLKAKQLNNLKAIKQLESIGPPPYDADAVFKERILVQELDGQMSIKTMASMGKMALRVKETSIFDLPGTISAFRFTMNAMWHEVSTLNLLKLVPVLKVPVFFFLGKKDHWVLPQTSKSYFNKLFAPVKKLVIFENSGHEPFVDEPEKFNKEMLDLVRPYTV